MRRVLILLLVLSLQGCLVYEYEHEFWLDVDGSGRVFVTGQPWLWTAFKGMRGGPDADEAAAKDAARALFESSGLRVRRVTVTRRQGRPYLFVAAEFDDIGRLGGTPAFPDLQLHLRRTGERLHLEGQWKPRLPLAAPGHDTAGLMAVRFHLPSKVYEHRNAADGVERGNIVAWRQELSAALRGQPMPFGAVMDERSILWSTVGLFGGAILLALATLGAGLYFAFRRGRSTASSPASRN